MSFLARKIRKNFAKVDVFYVGAKALDKFQTGWWFTESAGAPKEYDLKQY